MAGDSLETIASFQATQSNMSRLVGKWLQHQAFCSDVQMIIVIGLIKITETERAIVITHMAT